MRIPGNSPISFAFLFFAAGFTCHHSSSLTPPMWSVIFAVKQKKYQIFANKIQIWVSKKILWLYRGVSVYFRYYKSENKVEGKTYLSRCCHYRTRATIIMIMLISLRAGNVTSSWRPPRCRQCLLKVSFLLDAPRLQKMWVSTPFANTRVAVTATKESQKIPYRYHSQMH